MPLRRTGGGQSLTLIPPPPSGPRCAMLAHFSSWGVAGACRERPLVASGGRGGRRGRRCCRHKLTVQGSIEQPPRAARRAPAHAFGATVSGWPQLCACVASARWDDAGGAHICTGRGWGAKPNKHAGRDTRR
eukprot:scaffold1929_cov376-Prasinococcus_capsulatus_cf.AAC.16